MTNPNESEPGDWLGDLADDINLQDELDAVPPPDCEVKP